MEDLFMHIKSRTGIENGCWIWAGCKTSDGYGKLYYEGKAQLVHRLMYVACHPEEDIKDLVIRHTCDNPSCCNPAHLISGTQADNVQDMDSRGRRVISVEECNGRAKLTHDDVYRIKYLTPNMSCRELAHEYKVSRNQIYRIRNNQAWANV